MIYLIFNEGYAAQSGDGRRTEAATEYRRALGLTDNARERAFYAARLTACEPGEAASPGDTRRA